MWQDLDFHMRIFSKNPILRFFLDGWVIIERDAFDQWEHALARLRLFQKEASFWKESEFQWKRVKMADENDRAIHAASRLKTERDELRRKEQLNRVRTFYFSKIFAFDF